MQGSINVVQLYLARRQQCPVIWTGTGCFCSIFCVSDRHQVSHKFDEAPEASSVKTWVLGPITLIVKSQGNFMIDSFIVFSQDSGHQCVADRLLVWLIL